MSVPKATELAAIVAVRVVFPAPLNTTEPDKSPPNEIVLGVVNWSAKEAVVAVAALPWRAPLKVVAYNVAPMA